GIPEWCIDGETGLLFDAEHPEGLKGKIREILQDDNLRLKLTRQGMSHLKTVYNEEQHFKKLSHLFQKALPIR
ncbi:MAG: glycosyltransferase, partial [Saprospiraceae bacterium]